ncbi:MAG TPA: kelch repeat-containing protein [Candidatus Angelobacter sp.]|nr:kelch repeat-containing protein [Candidatus Angelobacter sp.]
MKSMIVKSTAFFAAVFLFLSVCMAHAQVMTAWSGTLNPLNQARMNHTATGLQFPIPNYPGSHSVLVAGGEINASSVLNSAEVFNYYTGLWSLTPPMIQGRTKHTATLLRDGRVLVVGGYQFHTAQSTLSLASAEIYDPVANTWTATGTLNFARGEHSATLLADGTVLISGGQSCVTQGPRFTQMCTWLTSPEIFDPATGIFTALNRFPGPHGAEAASLLPNGDVLITGTLSLICTGQCFTPNDPDLYLPSLFSNQPATGLVNLFLSNPTFEVVPVYFGSHTSTTLPDGRVLIAGGYDYTPGDRVNYISFFYDSNNSQWATTNSNMLSPRANHTATLLYDGAVLLTGGVNRGDANLNPLSTTGSVEIFNGNNVYSGIPNDSWIAGGDLCTPRSQHAAVPMIDGNVLLAGGRDNSGNPLSSVELFVYQHSGVPATNTRFSRPSVNPSGGAGTFPVPASACPVPLASPDPTNNPGGCSGGDSVDCTAPSSSL